MAILFNLSVSVLRLWCGVTEPPPPMASRSLIMVAKCLQNLANLVEFGGKEPYMEVVNPFILKNKERMVVFLDQLSVSVLLLSLIYLQSLTGVI